MLVATVALSGCTVSVPQAQAVSNIIAGIFASDEPAVDQWEARVGDEVRYLTPVVAPSGIVFAREVNDAVQFDGWNITSVVGFNQRSALAIKVEGKTRFYSTRRRVVPVECGEWSYDAIESGAQWAQACGDDGAHMNFIFLDTNGRIIRISQVIDAGGTRIELRKL
jgi:hypothetical protein